jgi:hypothetical protein
MGLQLVPMKNHQEPALNYSIFVVNPVCLSQPRAEKRPRVKDWAGIFNEFHHNPNRKNCRKSQEMWASVPMFWDFYPDPVTDFGKCHYN